MTNKNIIALDAMGGDLAPDMVVEGTEIAAAGYPELEFVFFGDTERLTPLLKQHPGLNGRAKIHHTEEIVGPDDKPAQALRRGRGSSMGLSIRAVASGEAAAAVSAGNTGALMAMSKFMLKMLPGIKRPALASVLPTMCGESVMLDLGANIECDEDNLVQFAVMGAAYARVVMGLARPRVALLNVGVEELKGNESVKGAGQKLKDTVLPLKFSGFIEGDGIFAGTADVIVTDGFTGNVALKATEGTAYLILDLLEKAFRKSWVTKLGYLLSRGGLKAMNDRLNPNHHNGGVFLGVNGLVVKSHGGADAIGFASAVRTAAEMVRGDLCARISADLLQFDGACMTAEQVAAS